MQVVGKFVALALSFAVPSDALAVESGEDSDDVVVKGKQISKEEIGDSQPVAALSKEEIVAVVSTGRPACKNGSVGAAFDGEKFRSGDEDFTADQLVERLSQLKETKKISCFHVQARHYDKVMYQLLEKKLVDQRQISLFWDESK